MLGPVLETERYKPKRLRMMDKYKSGLSAAYRQAMLLNHIVVCLFVFI